MNSHSKNASIALSNLASRPALGSWQTNTPLHISSKHDGLRLSGYVWGVSAEKEQKIRQQDLRNSNKSQVNGYLHGVRFATGLH